jgi:DNA-binding NtrC family response regulator/pSer/pThr/pTyr-binding forkhead associated (FHA) protein
MAASFLMVRTGNDVGRKFVLDAQRTIHVGRALGCEVPLTDPVSSRYHAVIFHESGKWQIRDSDSRNGTLVNGAKIDHATLFHDNVIQIGGTQLLFREESGESEEESLEATQTVLLDRTMQATASPRGLEVLTAPDEAGSLLDLYQLSLNLLSVGDTDEILSITADMLRTHTEADVVGLLWAVDGSRLQPERIVPAEAAKNVRLSAQLTKRVTKNREAIWIKEESGDSAEAGRWADAICIPLLCKDELVGALHLYREGHQFRQKDFELTIKAAGLLGVALQRSRAVAALQVSHNRMAEKNALTDELVGNCAAIDRLKTKIERIGKASGAVLIRGESGAGKELVARALHRHSNRRDRPMLSVNCAAIPRDLMESQLFGHMKGSFTGAESDHVGWFQQAHTGTLFLDEVGELTLEGQAKLLRILEGHPFLPVGGTTEVRVDVRVVAATNRDLAEFVREKRFREDLYYRLSVFELHIPPLRDRGEDIGLLMDHFLQHFKRQHGRPRLEFDPRARQRMLDYAWPGNVRQLRNVIDSAVVMTEGDLIGPDDLGLRDVGTTQMDTLRLDVWEQRLIREAIDRTNGNIPEAARLLGIGRATLYRKVSEYGLES